MDTFLTIACKRDQRQYADRDIPAEVRDRILDAGRIAGSAKYRQPWRFLVIESADVVERVAETVYASQNVLGARLVVAIVVEDSPGFDCGRASAEEWIARAKRKPRDEVVQTV